MCRKIFLLICFVLLLGLVAETIGATDPNIEYDAEIMETTAAPTIDGVVDAVWANAVEYPIDYIVVGPNEVNDTNDLYGTWKALWDYDNLYFLVEVNDEALYRDSGASWYEDDNVEIFIDANNSKTFESYDQQNDYQYLMPWNSPPEDTVYDGPSSPDGHDTLAGVVVAFQDTANGYRCEVKFPWATLWGNTPNDLPGPDSLIGVELQLDDDDDGTGRESTMLWSDGVYFGATNNSYRYASEFGTAKLISISGAGMARKPNPTNKKTGVPVNVTLSWKAGDYTQNVNGHEVYFGSTWNDVNDANTSDLTGIYRGSQNLGNESYLVPETLEYGETYYWRIDEVNDANIDSPWKGRVWRFTVTDFINIDNFESYVDTSYGDPNLLGTWTAGGGAVGYLQLRSGGTYPVQGDQSMEINYDTTVSTASRAPDTIDWTADDVGAILLWFAGDQAPNSEIAELFMELEDNVGTIAKLTYSDVDGVPDVNAILNPNWTRWIVDLQDFVDANNNLDLTNITRFTVGAENSTGYGGIFYVDTIGLKQAYCVSEYSVDADFDGDCMVNVKDLKVIMDDWLDSGYPVSVEAPNDANLAAWWKFDDAAGPNAVDSSGNDHTGTLLGGPIWVTGKFGGALQLDGVNESVLVAGYNGITGPNSRTASTWVKLDEAQKNEKNDVIRWGTTGVTPGTSWVLILDNGIPFLGVSYAWAKGDVVVTDGQWHLVTVSVPANAKNNDVQFYVDGRLNVSSYSAATRSINTDPVGTVSIGIGNYANYYEGLMDDVRIYDYVLSDLEVMYLYTGGTGDFPLQNRTANLYEDEQIDFKDFAVLADSWLEEQLWP